MSQKFLTSAEASVVTGCSLRQLQQWRLKEIVIPTINTRGKGSTVYYTVADIFVLMLIEYFLSIGCSFEFTHKVLEILRKEESWLFVHPFDKTHNKRFVILMTDSPTIINYVPEIVLALVNEGQAILPFSPDILWAKLYKKIADDSV